MATAYWTALLFGEPCALHRRRYSGNMRKDKERKENLARRAATQRRYAQRLKATKAPRAEDMARALLKAARACVAPPISENEGAAWRRLVAATVEELVKQGFSRLEAGERLRRVLWPQGPISR